MKNTITKLAIGGSGMLASGFTDHIASVSPQTVSDTASLLVQIVIAIVTLFGLFKKKRVTKKIKN